MKPPLVLQGLLWMPDSTGLLAKLGVPAAHQHMRYWPPADVTVVKAAATSVDGVVVAVAVDAVLVVVYVASVEVAVSVMVLVWVIDVLEVRVLVIVDDMVDVPVDVEDSVEVSVDVIVDDSVVDTMNVVVLVSVATDETVTVCVIVPVTKVVKAIVGDVGNANSIVTGDTGIWSNRIDAPCAVAYEKVPPSAALGATSPSPQVSRIRT
jgi:hypothetical protein